MQQWESSLKNSIHHYLLYRKGDPCVSLLEGAAIFFFFFYKKKKNSVGTFCGSLNDHTY